MLKTRLKSFVWKVCERIGGFQFDTDCRTSKRTTSCCYIGTCRERRLLKTTARFVSAQTRDDNSASSELGSPFPQTRSNSNPGRHRKTCANCASASHSPLVPISSRDGRAREREKLCRHLMQIDRRSDIEPRVDLPSQVQTAVFTILLDAKRTWTTAK